MPVYQIIIINVIIISAGVQALGRMVLMDDVINPLGAQARESGLL